MILRGLLSVAGAAALLYIGAKSVAASSGSALWSMIGILGDDRRTGPGARVALRRSDSVGVCHRERLAYTATGQHTHQLALVLNRSV